VYILIKSLQLERKLQLSEGLDCPATATAKTTTFKSILDLKELISSSLPFTVEQVSHLVTDVENLFCITPGSSDFLVHTKLPRNVTGETKQFLGEWVVEVRESCVARFGWGIPGLQQ